VSRARKCKTVNCFLANQQTCHAAIASPAPDAQIIPAQRKTLGHCALSLPRPQPAAAPWPPPPPPPSSWPHPLSPPRHAPSPVPASRVLPHADRPRSSRPRSRRSTSRPWPRLRSRRRSRSAWATVSTSIASSLASRSSSEASTSATTAAARRTLTVRAGRSRRSRSMLVIWGRFHLSPCFHDQVCGDSGSCFRGRAAALRSGRDSRRSGSAGHRSNLPRLGPPLEGHWFFGVHEGSGEFVSFLLRSRVRSLL
jgi:hypothetical protein